MYLLIIVLYNEKYVKEILRKFVEIGVRGATLIRSQGMASLLSDEVPIFSSLRHMFEETEGLGENYTIFSAIKTEETLNKATEAVLKIVKDIDKPGTGVMIVQPVLKIYGLAQKV
jgi:hypothetical protein